MRIFLRRRNTQLMLQDKIERRQCLTTSSQQIIPSYHKRHPHLLQLVPLSITSFNLIMAFFSLSYYGNNLIDYIRLTRGNPLSNYLSPALNVVLGVARKINNVYKKASIDQEVSEEVEVMFQLSPINVCMYDLLSRVSILFRWMLPVSCISALCKILENNF